MTDKQNINVNSKGIGLAGLLTIIFVIAKLTNLIDWSWVTVFLPVIISAGIGVAFLIVLLIGAIVIGVFND